MEWYYYPREAPKKVDGIKAKSKRGEIGETWWSKRWVDTLKSFDMGARLDRGRSYARRGQVVSIKINKGIVYAQVQGTRDEPYSVKIKLPVLSDAEWEEVTNVMASQAIFAAKLLSGEMPRNIEEAFDEAGASLFPESKKELDTDCSCPDWANPCKHIAAVYYLLAERFDEDPFLIFLLRGRTKEEIIEVLREKRATALPQDIVPSFTASEVSTIPLEECLDTFWEARETLHSFATNFVPPEENVILKRLGDAPFTIKGENLSCILSKIYDSVSSAALRKASEEKEIGGMNE